MDVGPIQFWKSGSSYKKHEIVQVGNLAYPDPDNQIILENGTGDWVSLTSSKIENAGDLFPVNNSIEYIASCMLKKDKIEDALKDQNRTLIQKKTNAPAASAAIDTSKSIGVGIGLDFYSSTNQKLQPDDYRFTYRLMASSELDDKEWVNVQIHVRQQSIPEDAAKARVVLICFGHSSGEFMFTNINAGPASRFFYCMKAHDNSTDPLVSYNNLWTQEFFWRPSYGGTAQFSAVNENLKIGEGGDYVNNLAINSLPMSLNLQFDNKTDLESRAIVHFLQEKFFAYDSIFSLDYKGERLLSSEVQSFKFNYTYPYRQDLMYTCTDFNHSIIYRNKHSISATFICNTESTLQSVESHSGYNKNLDAILPVTVDGTAKFEKGVPITFKTYSVEPDSEITPESAIAASREERIADENQDTSSVDLTSIVNRISRYPEDESQLRTGGIITFASPYSMEIGSCVYITVDFPERSIFNVGLAVIEGRLDEYRYYYNKLVPGVHDEIAPPLRPIGDDERNPLQGADDPNEFLVGFDEGETPVDELGYKVVKLSRCPWNCLSTAPLIPEGMETVPKSFVDENGNEVNRVLYLPNYRRVELNSNIVPLMEEITFTPLDNFEMSESFDLIIPAIQGRSSIYLNQPNEIQKYPYLRIRNFEQRPSQAFTIEHSPDHIQSEFTKVYNKKFKRGINQNLSTFNITFEQRSDKEAKDILQFLESHLGYKKFRFQMPRPYLSDTEYHTSLSGKSSCIFYCPSWTHVVKFKNNHTINATFIESNTFENENLNHVFGLQESRTSERPCYEAEIYNFITKYEMCPFSSILEAAITYAEGRDYADDDPMIATKGKQVDMVFIVDTDSQMFSALKYIGDNGVEGNMPKIDVVIDVLKKMATSYGIYVAPGTEDFDQPSIINAPEISENVPPWPIDSTTSESLAQAAFNDFYENYPNLNNHPYQFSQFYDANQTRRFKVKIGLKEVNIGIVLVNHEEPLVTLVGGGKNELLGYEDVKRTVEDSEMIEPNTAIDEDVFPMIRQGSASVRESKYYSFTLDLVDNSFSVLQSIEVKDETGNLDKIMIKSIRKLMQAYKGKNDSWFTFVIGATTTGRLVYYIWEKERVQWTNQVTGETKEIKYLKKKVAGRDEGNKNYRIYVMLFNEKGQVQKQKVRNVVKHPFLGTEIVNISNSDRITAWVDTEEPLRGFTGNRVGSTESDSLKTFYASNLSDSQKEDLATQARAYALYYADIDEVLPQPYEKITEREVVDKVPIYSKTNKNDYFDKVIIYNKLNALTLEAQQEANYLDAAREAMYQLFFSTRAETVNERYIFIIGRGEPAKSAVNLLGELRQGRDLALRRPNDYDLFREKIITDNRPPIRHDGKKMLPWYEDQIETKVIMAGTMGVTDGPSNSGKKYAYDFFENQSNPHGHIEVSSDKYGKIPELGAFMDIFKTIEIICTDTGYQNMFKVTIHNCGPHVVKLLNTLVFSRNQEESIQYTTELLASGIPKGGGSGKIETITAGEDMTVAIGSEDGSILQNDDDSIISADAEDDDPMSVIVGVMDNSFLLGEGGQFFGDPNNTNLLDSKNDRKNIKWESFNTKYEVHRAGIVEEIDGGWKNHKSESRGVYNDGVAFKNMPVRIFRLKSGLEIIDYNIGNISTDNQKRGSYEHIPELEPGQDIDLFFGIRSATYDINDRATSGFEDIQLIFNAEDHTMNKMDFYANVTFRAFGQKIKFDFTNERLDPFFPYGLETPPDQDDDEEEEAVVSPIQGTWEFSGATLHTDMSLIVEFGPAITSPGSDGKPMSNNDGQIIGVAKFRSNIDFDLFDNKKLWNTLSNNSDISETQQDGSILVVASLPAGKATEYGSYVPPTLVATLDEPMETYWDGTYLLRDNELYIFSNSLGTGQTSSTGNYLKKPLVYEDGGVVYNALDGSIVSVEDPRSTTFQYKFEFDNDNYEESDSGSGNNWKKSMTANGHGDYYISEGFWADPRLIGGQPQPPNILEPEASAAWIGDVAKSQSAKITKL